MKQPKQGQLFKITVTHSSVIHEREIFYVYGQTITEAIEAAEKVATEDDSGAIVTMAKRVVSSVIKV